MVQNSTNSSKVRSRFLNVFNNHADSKIAPGSWTHVKEIPNSNLLVSLHHDYYKTAASMEVIGCLKERRSKENLLSWRGLWR